MGSFFLWIAEPAAMAAGLGDVKLGAERVPHIAWGHASRKGIIRCRAESREPIVAQQDPGVRLAKFLGYRRAESAMTHNPLAGNELGTVTGNEIDGNRVWYATRHGESESFDNREAFTHLAKNHREWGVQRICDSSENLA